MTHANNLALQQHYIGIQAYQFFKEGKQYVLRGGEVVVIDESTGRLRPDTRWQGGIHQVRQELWAVRAVLVVRHYRQCSMQKT